MASWFGRLLSAAAPEKAPTLRDAYDHEIDAFVQEYCSTSGLSTIHSTRSWADIDVGIAIDGPYRGELIMAKGGRILSHTPPPAEISTSAKNNG